MSNQYYLLYYCLGLVTVFYYYINVENLKLLQLLESVLGKGKPTSGHNIAFFSPFVSHYKPKLEININTDNNGQNPWHCWISDKKGRVVILHDVGLIHEVTPVTVERYTLIYNYY